MKAIKLLLLTSIFFMYSCNQVRANDPPCDSLYADSNVKKSKDFIKAEGGKLSITGVNLGLGVTGTVLTGYKVIPIFLFSIFPVICDSVLGATTGSLAYSWSIQMRNDAYINEVIISAKEYLNDNHNQKKFLKFYKDHNFLEQGISKQEVLTFIQQFNYNHKGLCQLFDEDDDQIATLYNSKKAFFLYYPKKVFVENLKNSILASKGLYDKIMLQSNKINALNKYISKPFKNLKKKIFKRKKQETESRKEQNLNQVVLSALEFLENNRENTEEFYKFYKKHKFQDQEISELEVAQAIEEFSNYYIEIQHELGHIKDDRDNLFLEKFRFFDSEERFVINLKNSIFYQKNLLHKLNFDSEDRPFQDDKSALDIYEKSNILKSKTLIRQEARKFIIQTGGIAVGITVTVLTAGTTAPFLVVASFAGMGIDFMLGATTFHDINPWRKQANNDFKMAKLIRSSQKYLLDDERKGKTLTKFIKKYNFIEEGFTHVQVAEAIIDFNESKLAMTQEVNMNYGTVADLTPNIVPFFLFLPEEILARNLKNFLHAENGDLEKIESH